MLTFAFPADPLNPRRVDEYFARQRSEFERAGFVTVVVPAKAFETAVVIRSIAPSASVVYRGWMIDESEYRNCVASITLSQGRAYTSLDQYLLAHHLPNWYPFIRHLTPETVIYSADSELESELRVLGWSAFFIKDYVKSLKTTVGSLIVDPSEAKRVVEDMRRYRGKIEGGICVRRVEEFIPNSEVRYFVLRGQPFARAGAVVPSIVGTVTSVFEHPFFSIDVASTPSGDLRVVEIGDGQVSDLVGWTVEDFVRTWRGTA